jgi:hypothetical protein
VLAPAGASGQAASGPAPAETFLLRQPVPDLTPVPESSEFGFPGPVDLDEAAWFMSPEAPEDASIVLRTAGFREGHLANWVDPGTLQGIGILVLSFDHRIDGPSNERWVAQRAADELGPEAERLDTSSVPNSSGFSSAEGVTVAFRRGQYSGYVVASPLLPGRRQVALDVAARQYSTLPDPTPSGSPRSGEQTADELGSLIAQAGISLGMLVLVCVVAVAIFRSFRRTSSPPPAAGSATGGPWAPPPGGWPPAPTSAPPAPPEREPVLAGARRKGSTI